MRKIILTILILLWCSGVWGITLSNNAMLGAYYYCGDTNYQYGVLSSDTSQIIKRSTSGVVTNGLDISSLSASYDSVSRIFSTNTNGLIFAVVKDTETSTYFMLKSVDGGSNWGDNSPSFNDGDYVMQIGLDGASHTADVRALGESSFLDATISEASVLFFAEYNVNVSRTDGSTNDRIRLMKSTDNGTTWAEVITFNNDGSNRNIRHFHSIQQDPYTNDIYIACGDVDAQNGILRWNGTSDISAYSNQNPIWFGTLAGNVTYAANGISTGSFYGAQRYRAGDILFDDTYMYWGADNKDEAAERGIWKGAKDLTTASRVDNSVASYDDHSLLSAIKTTGGYFIFVDFLEGAPPDTRAYVRLSEDGSTYTEVGTVGMKDFSGPVIFYEWNGKLYIFSQNLAGGIGGELGGTLEISVNQSYLESPEPRILSPVYYITTSGNDSNDGRSVNTAWATVNRAISGGNTGAGEICRGGIVKIASGSYNEGATQLESDYDSVTATTGNTIFKGAGENSTIIYGSSTNFWTLYKEETNTEIRDLNFYTTTTTAFSFYNSASTVVYFYNVKIGSQTSGYGPRNYGTMNIYNSTLEVPLDRDYNIRNETTGTLNIISSILIGSDLFSVGNTGNGVLKVLNSSFYNFGYQGVYLIAGTAGIPTIRNNIFYGDGSSYAIYDNAGLVETDGEIDYNIFFNTTLTNIANSGGSHSLIDTNPLFTDAAGGNFFPLSTSPAMGRGQCPFVDGDGDQYDMAGNLIWSDTTDAPVGPGADGWEIGAYQRYQAYMVHNQD